MESWGGVVVISQDCWEALHFVVFVKNWFNLFFLDIFILGFIFHFGYYILLSTRHATSEKNRALLQASLIGLKIKV